MLSLCVVKVFSLDVSKQLEAYEVEYHVLQEEMSAVRGWKGHSPMDSCSPNDTSDHLARLQIENEALRRQKTELLDQLQVVLSVIKSCVSFLSLYFLHCKSDVLRKVFSTLSECCCTVM